MTSDRAKAAVGYSIGLALTVAILTGVIMLLDGPLGGRRAAVASVLGVYVAGGVFFGGILLHLSLRTLPPALWEPGDGRQIARRFAFSFFYWPLYMLFGLFMPLFDAVESARWPRWLRTTKR